MSSLTSLGAEVAPSLCGAPFAGVAPLSRPPQLAPSAGPLSRPPQPALSALVAAGEAFFGPALGALTADIAPGEQLGSANALTGLAESAASVPGPALAGTVVAAAGPAVVIAADAASYAVSLTALALLRLPAAAQARAPARAGARSPVAGA